MVIAFAFHQVSDYKKEIEIMKTMSQDEFVAYIRRSVIKLIIIIIIMSHL
jgi:hypothetical protein